WPSSTCRASASPTSRKSRTAASRPATSARERNRDSCFQPCEHPSRPLPRGRMATKLPLSFEERGRGKGGGGGERDETPSPLTPSLSPTGPKKVAPLPRPTVGERAWRVGTPPPT